MDQKPNVSIKNADKPSKLLALTALVFAFALPFILVKSFPHKQQLSYNNSKMRLNVLPLSTETSDNRANNIKEPPKQITPAPKIATTAKFIVPELPKPPSSANADQLVQKTLGPKPLPKVVNAPLVTKIVYSKKRDSFAKVFSRVGLDPQILKTIIKDNPKTRVLSDLKPNQKLEFQLRDRSLEKLTIPLTTREYLTISREGEHYKSLVSSYKVVNNNRYVTATIHGSLYTTAKRLNIPYKLIQQMTEIFAGEINFAKDVRSGDQFTILYKTIYIGDTLINNGDILAVSYKSRGKVFQAVQHTDRSGHTDYYSPQGTSLKKAFNRYPLRFSHISSTFSLSRNHPILHYKRPHKGIDLAAPIGTPILATGDGRIEIIGRQSGYGNMIKINHNNQYSTIYGHMLRFQKGLSKGSYVKRGQVIGFVGQTGLASGPHCHYEFHINKQPKNPTTVELPKGFGISGRELANFRAKSNTMLAQLKLFSEGRLANANKPSNKIG